MKALNCVLDKSRKALEKRRGGSAGRPNMFSPKQMLAAAGSEVVEVLAYFPLPGNVCVGDDDGALKAANLCVNDEVFGGTPPTADHSLLAVIYTLRFI